MAHQKSKNVLFMPVIKSQDKETRVERLLVALDSLWGKLVIIVVILCVGFKGGCYFQETKMTRNQLQKDKEQWEKWVDKEANYRSEIDRLKQERLELKAQINNLKFIKKIQ